MMQTTAGETNSFEAFLPREPGLRAHVRRVAALAGFVASQSGFSPEQVQVMEHAALLHHLQAEATGMPLASRLLADLGFPAKSFEPSSPIPPDAAEIVKSFRGHGAAASPNIALFASILDSANLFDEQMENLPYEDDSTIVAINRLLDSGMLARSFAGSLRRASVAMKQRVSDASKCLPVFPKAAMEALRLARNPESSPREIERALANDPVLAGEVVKLANSVAAGSFTAVNSLSGALIRVGTVAAGNLIAAAAVRACFASVKLQDLWRHSSETGQKSEMMASLARFDPGEAYLAGLVHDIGRLPFETSEAGRSVRRWEEAGFPAVYAEMLAAGTDHAEVGAEILTGWNFPDSIVEAVRFHHRPELVPSKLAAVLYAVEDVNESLPSLARDHAAAKRLEVSELPQARAAG